MIHKAQEPDPEEDLDKALPWEKVEEDPDKIEEAPHDRDHVGPFEFPEKKEPENPPS